MKKASKKRRQPPRKQSSPRTRILVIDSDPVAAELVHGYLGDKRGYEVMEAATGAEGVKMAREKEPHLILLSFRLDDMGGLDVHEMLRQDPATKGIPVIYVSSFFTLRAIERATIKGAKGFLNKPFTLTDIYSKVSTVLGP